ncbi:helix-turn-helix domain-containing protein [Listeria weihenstephanensis]|uniref:Helix-turn-helix domain-containing protein n=1 Tax=Listeria weihenstephanensis TaxID=1006155 RepID=A0A841ZC95_9LIST|nr:Rgg/GadR/MutR family transcriptional regulator [Listeria weihenstephanensis]MBC1502136.1 helix-turn-helix domain-containing protein [Listeria weihenstephanensis]
MKSYGAAIRQIRKNKSISQSDVSNNILARTTISKIENNNITPTITTVESIIIKLDVTMDELRFIKNDYKLSTREEIIADFFKLVSNTQTEQILGIISKCDTYLDNHPKDNMLEDIKTALKAALLLTNNEFEHAQELVKPIWERLEKIDHFSLIEVRLVCNILFYFPLDVIEKFVPRLLIMIDKYNAFDKSLNSLKAALLINTASIFMEHNSAITTSSLNAAILISKDINRFDLLASAYYLQGVNANDLSLIAKAKNIFLAIEKDAILFQFEKEYFPKDAIH